MTQSGGGEYSLGTATLTLRGDMQPLEKDLARMRRVIEEMEKRGTKIPAPNIPAPAPETQRGYDELLKTLEEMRRSVEQNGEAFRQLNGTMAGAGAAAGTASGSNGFGGAAAALTSMSVMTAKLLPVLMQLEAVQGAIPGVAAKLGLVSKAVPVLGVAAAAATPVLAGLGKAALALIPGLGQLALAALGLNAIFGVMAAGATAAIAPLQRISAEAGRLNKQVAEAGIFAAQNFAILGPDGKLVEGTARQMQMVRGQILKEYRGIQQEVANISGATAGQIYEGFNVILGNISSLGEKGTTENAAKLATRIAAGMNTLGIPTFQLRQEVNALMMGNIDQNAMMAKKLGITGDDVRRQQAQGTYYDFLMKKLEKLYEGQKVLALSLENVKSNFDDVNQAISAEAGQPLEADTARMMQTILVTFKNLQGSFTGFFKSIAEAVGPVIKAFGPIVSVLVSIGATASSVGRVIMDVVGFVTAALGTTLLAPLVAVARSIELIAKLVQIVGEGFAALINPVKAMFNVFADQSSNDVSSFFDQIFTGLDKVSGAIDAFNKKWAAMLLNASLGSIRAGMKLRGASEEDIQEAQNNFRDPYKLQTGVTDEVQLRALKLPPNIVKQIEDRDARLGTGSTRALNISKEWADIKQKAYQNEIKSLEQGITLMNKQREIAEAMSAVSGARRALVARSFELGVQVAASPEARLAAETRLADLKLSQEKEAIAERRGILQTERELQQRQMAIQEKQIRIQQEQLKIQLAEARADAVRVTNQTQAALQARANTKFNSPEYLAYTRELNTSAAEQTRNIAKIAGTKEALRLSFQAEAQLGNINGLEAQRLGLQEQQLDIQGQSAQFTREQQALMAQISQQEQAITNELNKATNEQNRKKAALEGQSAEIERQLKLQDQQGRLEKARADLAATRAKAEVQAAQRLEEVQSAQERARSGGGTASVIEAQIAAAAAGVTGMETAAEVQQRLYDARKAQMDREQELQRRQLEVQQMREASEVRISKIKLQGQLIDLAIQRAQILAEIRRVGLGQQRDALSQQVAGASTVPGLGAGTATFGRTGRMSLAAGYGMVDVRGSDRATVAQDAMDIIRANTARGVRTLIGGDQSGDVDATNLTGDRLADAVARGMDRHANRVGRGTFAIDLIAKEGTPVGIPLSGVSNRARNTGVAGTTPRGNLALHLGAGSTGTGAPAAPMLPPANTNPKLLRIMQAAKGAGFQGEDLIRMTAVAMAESSGNPNALNDNPRTGDLSYGAWQINMKGGMGPERRSALGISSNEELFDPAVNARAAKMLFDQRGFQPWENTYGNANYQRWIGQARAVAPSVMAGGAADGGVTTSTGNQMDGLQQTLREIDSSESLLTQTLRDLNKWLEKLTNIQSLEKETLTEQQLAERAQFEFEQRRALLTAEIMKTPQGQLGVAAGDAVSGGLRGGISGAMEALLSGGDVRQAVASALAQAGQNLMQATLDALLNPLLEQLEGGIFKAITGVDINAAALQGAATGLGQAAFLHNQAALALTAAASALGGGGASGMFSWASQLPSLIAGFAGGIAGAPDLSGAFGGANSLGFGAAMGMPNLVPAFTPALAAGGEIQYGLDYLVGEKNAEIVRFNKSGGKVYSNRALTQALGVPFQRQPGGAAAVAEGGGDSLGVPFMGAGSTGGGDSMGVPFMGGGSTGTANGGKAVAPFPGGSRSGSPATPGIPFLKASPGGSGGMAGVPGGSSGGPGGIARTSSLRLNLQTQVINGVEYATVEQVREAAAAAAMAGRDSAYDGMRNNPSIQRSLGMRG